MKNIFTFLLLLAFGLGGNAQESFSLSGNIKDASNGEDIVGANISVLELPSKGAVSNDYSFYSLTLPKGQYTFYFSYLGYKTQIQKIDLNKNIEFNIELQPETTSLDEVVVSAERSDVNVSSTEMGVSKLTISEIQSIPVIFGEQDIMKTIQLLPGVKPAGDGNAGFYVRGGSSDQNLILLDGAPVYNASHLLGFFSVFNSSAIKDVKLYKGSMPSEFGGRLSSVMDVKMLEGNDREYEVDGGIGLISSKLTVQGPIVKNQGSFIVSARRTYADLFLKLSNDPAQRDSRLYFYDLNLKANYRLGEHDRIYVSGYFGRDVLGFSDRFGFDWGNATSTIRWNHIINSRLFSNTSFIFSNYSYKIKINSNAQFDISSRIQDFNAKQNFDYFLNDHNTISFGFNAIHHTFMPGELESSSDNINSFFIQNKRSLESAIFVHNDQKINDNLSLSYGLRLNNFIQFGPGDIVTWDADGMPIAYKRYEKNQIVANYYGLAPRFSATYRIDAESSTKISYQTTYQYLHMISNSNSESPTDVWLPSSNNIKPAKSEQIALGYFRNFDDNNWEFSSEVYYKIVDGVIDYRTGAQTTFNIDVERELLYGQGKAYGVELLLKKSSGRINGWVSYTLSRSLKKFDQINNGNWFSAKQDRIHDFSVVANYQISEGWSFSSTWVYFTGNAVTFPSGRYVVDNQNVNYYTERNGYRMPDYHRLDIGLNYKNRDYKYQYDPISGENIRVKKRFRSSWNFSVYNVYGRENPYSVSFAESEDNPGVFQAVQLSLFKMIPSVTYNFSF